MKKFLKRFGAAFLCLCMLAGCAANDPAAETDETAALSETEAPAPKETAVTEEIAVVEEEPAPKDPFEEHTTVITAHSGCENTAPNSMKHILAAIESGAEFIEIDVRMADGRLYLSHDLPSDPAKCVDYIEFLKTIAPTDIRVNNDLKEEELILPVMEAAEEVGGKELAARMYFTGSGINRYGLNNIVLASLDAYEGLRERLWIGADLNKLAMTLRDTERIGTSILNVSYKDLTGDSITQFQGNGLNFSAWTVDSEKEIRFLLEQGVANITTRKPELALALREEIETEMRK